MEMHQESRQSLHRRRSALSLSLTDTMVLLLRCADCGKTRSENRVFLQSRLAARDRTAHREAAVRRPGASQLGGKGVGSLFGKDSRPLKCPGARLTVSPSE